jgi:hypothetical protein
MQHVLFFFSLLTLAFLFAKVEIHIEGPSGWAKSLPTWRKENRWSRWLYSSRPFTGYHSYLQAFVLVFTHLPFELSLTLFSWHAEARIMSLFILFWVVEDFLWFVLNPAFSLKKFRPEYIWWHKPTWWWIAPRDYWVFIPVGLALYWASCSTGQ